VLSPQRRFRAGEANARDAAVSLHGWFGRHEPDLAASHWDEGRFVTGCTVCGAAMIKLPGLPWKLREGTRAG
jgi:hypothetical protein